MMINNKCLNVLVISLWLSACGSSTNDSEQNSAAHATQATDTKTAQPEANTAQASEQQVKAILKGHKMTKAQDDMSNWQRGRVQFLNLEGGFYGIITDSGQKILPMNMAKEFAQHGAIVRIKGKVKNVMTIQQWGTPFTITDIELITPGDQANKNEM
ncbi:hypothetical protein [Colwellia chukchiensis]|nr:hypothetical protein [Colwellia chukchiensis]